MLDIVCGQRDRLKARNTELESTVRGVQTQLSELRAAHESLSRDNALLLDRLRSRGTGGDGAVVVDLERASGLHHRQDAGAERFRDVFEPSPISRVRNSASAGLRQADRLALRTGQLVMSSRNSLLMAFMYVVLLHLILTYLLWSC